MSKGKELDKIDMEPDDMMKDLHKQIAPYEIGDPTKNGGIKIIAPRLAGNLIFYGFDNETMTGINRGFHVTTDTKTIYRYNGGYFEDDGEDYLRDTLQKLLKEECTPWAKNTVIDWIKDCKNIQIDRELFNSVPEKLVLENCVYNMNTGETTEPWHDDWKTNKLPIWYNPDAKCPKWLKFIDEVNYPVDIPVLQEMFGYSFYKPYTFQVAFLLVGSGANGKGVTLHILESMFGKENISAIPLQLLVKDRFSKIELYNKYANICGDLSSSELKNEGIFKMLTGGDMISGEIKNVQGKVNFYNTAKLINSCNIIPEFKDKTYANLRRWVVLEYSNVFKPGTPECNPYLKEELIEEIPGIFNWAMKGWRRLKENGYFSEHRTIEDVQEYLKINQDEVVQFCNVCITEGDNKYTKKELYKYFKQYCLSVNLNMPSQTMFTQKMNRYGPPTLSECQITITKKGKKKKERGWGGIIYKPPLESDITSENDKNEKLPIAHTIEEIEGDD